MDNLESKKILEIEDLQTYYGRSHIIQGLSMHINRHEAVSILGRNGVGKTTTLRSIMGLTPRARRENKDRWAGYHPMAAAPVRSGAASVMSRPNVISSRGSALKRTLNWRRSRSKRGMCGTLRKSTAIFPC